MFCITAARAATEDRLLQLEADMLQYMETRERDKFFDITNRLKEGCKEAGNERLFYQAWGRQGVYEATQQYYESAHSIARQMKDYARQEGSIYGEYAAMHTEAMTLLQEDHYDDAQKAFLEAMDFRHHHFPNESAAEDLRELMKIAYYRNDIAMAKNYAKQMLAEPNLAPHHKGRVLTRLSIMAFEEDNAEEFNHVYNEMKLLKQTDNINTINLYTEVNYHIINGDYKQALMLVDRLAPDTCAECKAIIYHRLGDNEKAYQYMVLYKHISDSITHASHNSSLASLYLRMNNDHLRLEQERLINKNVHLRYRFYIAAATILIMLLLFFIYKRRKFIKMLKHRNTMLDYGRKGAERALKDINELSYYESKANLPLNMPVRVNKLCDHLANVTQDHCNKKVSTVFQTDLADDFEIATNAQALEKLLLHLLNSSSTYTVKGIILLKCAKSGDMVMFSVTDTSKVLDSTAQQRTSAVFAEQEDTTRDISMNFNICQSISRLLHGRIWHDTTYTDGTRFCFEIPQGSETARHATAGKPNHAS